ncbi:MAG: hypothetical protein H8E38_06010 [SAR324 cluster bacterium]|nr:hypothetical protein [SAR324 cluster bacterium]MBL7035010.1 hypothetical protein [SAR324 cluster bacterium]
MEILEDPSGDLTIEDVRAPEFSSQFKISPTHRPNFGFTQSAFWFRFQIKNPESYSHTVALENYAVYDQIQLHQFTDDQYRFQNKELFSMVISQKPRWDLFVFELEFAPHQTKTFYLRVTSAITLQFVPKIWEPDLLRELRLKEHFYFGLLWGFLGILAVFNIYIYLTLRDRAFLYYAAYLICLIFYRMEANWWDTIYVFSFIPRVC